MLVKWDGLVTSRPQLAIWETKEQPTEVGSYQNNYSGYYEMYVIDDDTDEFLCILKTSIESGKTVFGQVISEIAYIWRHSIKVDSALVTIH